MVFDLDGTLIHSHVDFRLMKKRVLDVLEQEGVPSSLFAAEMSTTDLLALTRRYLIGQGSGERWGRTGTRINESMNMTEMEALGDIKAVEGARETLSWIRESGSSIGLLTRASREYTRAALDRAGLDVVFDAMICRDDFPESEAKPNGRAMVRMAERLGLHVSNCLLVGDHPMDHQCASSASAHFVGVLTGAFDKEGWARYGCKDVIESVRHLPAFLSDKNLYLPSR